jgi:hypothetical protein
MAESTQVEATVETALDGNAIGGLLYEVFGREMTVAVGTCGSCGASRMVAEFLVYLRGPGTVARCRDCTAVLIVITRRASVNCVDLMGLAKLTPA